MTETYGVFIINIKWKEKGPERVGGKATEMKWDIIIEGYTYKRKRERRERKEGRER